MGESAEPILCEVTRGPFAHPLMKKILEAYGRRAFARSSACMGFIGFLDQIKAGEGGGTALEIGTYHGITALLLAERFDKVISVSVDDEDPGRLLKRELAEFAGIRNIEFYDAKDNVEKGEIVRALSFDFAYSDGDHTKDTVADWKLVKRCGRVLFHEVWPLQPPVWNLVHSLPPEEVTWCESDILAYWERRG